MPRILRASLGLFIAASIVVAFSAPEARSAEVMSWTLESRFVDPAGPTPFNSPPPGVAARPNALRVNAYLPDGYDGQRRFPVLWLLHGHGDSYDTWENPKRGDLLNVARGLDAIVVTPEGAQGWYTDWWSGGTRRPGWESFYLEELMPFVSNRLKILPGRRWHAIAGNSMGGQGAAYIAEQRPGYFGSLASFSGTLSTQRPEWPGAFATQGQDYATVYGDPNGFYATGHNPTALAQNIAHDRVFVASGNGVPGLDELGSPSGALAELAVSFHSFDFAAAARAAGAQTDQRYEQGIHDWPYWRRYLAEAIDWGLFEAVDESPSRWSYTTTNQHARAWDVSLDFTEPPTTLERFERDGELLRGMGSGTVAVATCDGQGFVAELPFERRLPVGSGGGAAQWECPGQAGTPVSTSAPGAPSARAKKCRRKGKHKHRPRKCRKKRHRRSG